MFRREFEEGNVHKQYLARVIGRVPPGTTLVDQPLACKNHREAIHEISAEVSPRELGATWLRACKGKPSQTRVTLLAAGEGELEGQSLVLLGGASRRGSNVLTSACRWLGCPIGNDPLYGPAGVGSTAAGADAVKSTGSNEERREDAGGKRDLEADGHPLNKKRKTELGVVSEVSPPPSCRWRPPGDPPAGLCRNLLVTTSFWASKRTDGSMQASCVAAVPGG
eukprot:763268-Hanusia_phi.AAC.6